jgi:serine/threonine protein kinase
LLRPSQTQRLNQRLSSFKIDLEDFKIIKHLGRGCFGRVELVQEQVTNNSFAAKIISTKNMKAGDRQSLIREIEILAQMNHFAVLSLRGYQLPTDLSKQSAATLTDYMVNGSLETVMKKASTPSGLKGWDLTQKYITMIGVAAGMQYLHTCNRKSN